MSWEAIELNRDLCNGCATCVDVCPLDNLRMGDDGYPYVKYDECWYCEACELECPEHAVTVILPYLVR